MQMPTPLTGKKIQNYIFNYSDFLGNGNFSKCYKARNTKTNEEVAIKIVELNSLKSKKLEELLFSEIEVLKQMSHPNVLRCLEVFTSNRNCYIITELCNEGDLEGRIKKKHKLEQWEINNVIADVYKGLKYLASKNIVHRDLKIANIFIHQGVAKIADFGFALHSKNNFKDLNIGSPLYMSPQGILDNLYGPKTDVWAFGIMVYELHHGKTPFHYCQTEDELRSNVVRQLQWAQLKSDISNQIKQLIINCLQVREQKRPTIAQLINNSYLCRVVQNRELQSSAPELKFKANLKYKEVRPMQMQQQMRGKSHMKMRSAFSSQEPSFFASRPYQRMISPNKTAINPSNSAHGFHSINSSINNQSNGFQSAHNSRNIPKMVINIPIPQTKKLIMNDQSFQSVTSAKSPVLFAQESLNRGPTAQTKKTYIVNCIVTFKECVSLLHYCRLIFKYLTCFKELTSLVDSQQKEHYASLGQFLIYCLDEIFDVVTSKGVKYQGQNPQVRQRKLLQVTEQYRNKYNKQLDRQLISKFMQQKKGSELNLNTITHLAATQSSSLWVDANSPPQQIIVGELLLVIFSSTQLLSQCLKNKNFSKFQKSKQIEETLNKSKDSFTYGNYSKHKGRIFGSVVNTR